MILGVSTALIWQAWPKLGFLPDLPSGIAGLHGFVVGVAVGLVVIVMGTFVGKPASAERIARAWGE